MTSGHSFANFIIPNIVHRNHTLIKLMLSLFSITRRWEKETKRVLQRGIKATEEKSEKGI